MSEWVSPTAMTGSHPNSGRNNVNSNGQQQQRPRALSALPDVVSPSVSRLLAANVDGEYVSVCDSISLHTDGITTASMQVLPVYLAHLARALFTLSGCKSHYYHSPGHHQDTGPAASVR